MKVERPQMIALNAEQGEGKPWCASGSGATLGGGKYLYCIEGTAQSGSVAYCTSGGGKYYPAGAMR